MFKKMESKISKLLAVVLIAVLVVGIIPTSLMGALADATNYPNAVTISVVNEDNAPVKDAAVTYTILDATDAVIKQESGIKTDENGEIAIISDTVPADVRIGKLEVSCDGYWSYVNDSYNKEITSLDDDFEVKLFDNKDMDVTANELTYDSEKAEGQEAVTIVGKKDGDVITYSGAGVSADGKVINAGDYTVGVTIKRDTYYVFEKTVNVTVKSATIEGITVKANELTYDPEKAEGQEVVTIVGKKDGDVITYSGAGVSADGKVTDAGSYEVGVKITRDTNYVFETTVNVTVEKAENSITFNPPSAVTYNKDKTISLLASATHDCENCNITYSITNAGTTGATINGNTITYTSVGTIEVKAYIPECGNYKECDVSRSIVINYATASEYTITDPKYKRDNCDWYNGDVVIKPKEVGWSIATSENDEFSSELTIKAEGVYSEYKLVFKDENGNLSNVITLDKFAIDKTAPSDIYVEFKDKYTDPISKVIHILSFGLFCNEEVEATVTCEDAASGVESIKMFKYADGSNEGEEVELDKDETNVFTLPMDFKGTVKVEVIDNVGNSTDKQLITKQNSNIGDDNGFIMIEETEPILLIKNIKPNDGTRIQEGTNNYSGDVIIPFEVQDTDSGLYSVKATLNGNEYSSNDFETQTFEKQDTYKHEYKLTTADQTPDTDGNYKFHVEVTDNAGNVTTDDITVSIDRTSPVITSFDFVDVNGEQIDSQDVVSIEDYGYYFAEEATVTVYAKDEKINKDDNELVSGVDTITVVLVDNEGKKYTVTAEGITEIENMSEACAHTVDENNAFSFEIVENFKGQIYAMATDKVGNNPTNSVFSDSSDGVITDENSELKGYKHPTGSILESQDKHNEEIGHIIFEKAEAPYKTNDGGDLYKEDVDVTITVTDTYSGIGEAYFNVVAPYDTLKNYEEATQVGNIIKNENEKSYYKIGDYINGWEVKETDKNLVTKMSKTITVSNDSNNIKVYVELTDRAGNTSEDELVFSIDKTAPEIIVEMDDKDDEKYDGFFKKNRTATIIVKERNFKPELAEFFVDVTDDEGETTKVKIKPDFDEVKAGGKPASYTNENGVEYYTYKMKYTFKKEGDYTFDVSAKDLVDHKNSAVSYVNSKGENIKKICKKFTIDKTLPDVSVKFINNEAVNGKYFPKPRTATVTIVEHNFDKNRVDWSGLKASLNGRAIATPEIDWGTDPENKNIHIATIKFTADGDYKFDVYVTDKANNKSKAADFGNSVAPKDFVIDKTITKPIISGIENGSAYKGDVIPTISFTDANYANSDIKLTRTRMDEKDVDVTEKYITGVSVQQGISGTFDTFTKEPETDGIYTLSINVEDKAGNKESETYTFTVNRFGSVYRYNDELIRLIKDGGQYVKSVEKDIVITEYNAVRIEDSLEILVTRGGEKIDVDYTSNPENIKTQVGVGNSGWYEYVYTIKASNFKEDGAYKISLLSKYNTSDAKNIKSASTPKNSIDTNNKQVKDNMNFVVDSVAPELRNVVNLGKAIVNAQKLDVEYSVFDDGGLASIEVIINDKIEKITDFDENGFNYSGKFTLEEMAQAQTIQFRITDLAGNITDTAAENFSTDGLYIFNDEVTVSTNFFVRWYANKLLFWGPIVGIIVLAGAAWYIITAKKKKEEK